jgi:hypothetical protein
VGGVFPELLSLVAGIATGIVFERRATGRERRHSEDLQRQVSVLKTSVLSLGGSRDGAGESNRPPQDLAGAVTKRALETQDAAGKVTRQALKAYFVEQGNSGRDIDAAIESLCETGVAEKDGQWLQMI